jgi:hypothetical protein
MTEYVFDPPQTIEALQFAGNEQDLLDVLDWINLNIGPNDHAEYIDWMKRVFIYRVNDLILDVEFEDYVYIINEGNLGKVKAPMFDLLYRVNSE